MEDVAKVKRFMLSLNKEQGEKLDRLKKDIFYNKSQAEMIRYLIELGLSAHEANKASNQ